MLYYFRRSRSLRLIALFVIAMFTFTWTTPVLGLYDFDWFPDYSAYVYAQAMVYERTDAPPGEIHASAYVYASASGVQNVNGQVPAGDYTIEVAVHAHFDSEDGIQDNGFRGQFADSYYLDWTVINPNHAMYASAESDVENTLNDYQLEAFASDDLY